MTLLASDVPFWSAPLSSDVPMGEAPATEIFEAGPVDHVAVGLERLLQQFKGGAHPRIQALVAAPLDTSNRLEGVLWTLLTLTGLPDAVGGWLDEWGAILGLERDGWTDDRYRELLYAQLYALRSCGTVEDIYRVFEQLDAAWVGGIDQFDDDPDLDPASFRLTWLEPALGHADAETYRRFLKKARAAGVRVWFYSYPIAEEFVFSLADDGADLVDSVTEGFSAADDYADADGTDGGGFAREVIA